MEMTLNIAVNGTYESTPNPFKLLRTKMIENGKPVSLRRLEELFKNKLTFSMISRLESGQVTPSYDILVLYHDFFGVSYDFLMGNSSNPKLNDDTSSLYPDIEKNLRNLAGGSQEELNSFNYINKMLSTDKGLLALNQLANNKITSLTVLKYIEGLDDSLTYNELVEKVKEKIG